MKRQIIEIAGEAVGALMPEGDAFRFMAVKFHVWPFDGERFASHHDALRALTAHLNDNCAEAAEAKAS
ncbi:hypothetical protein [Rhizobium sp. CC-YZS058]|uniref:hypothetical protein n=1 Tax=Rhizobium sp. CC-YZS058 TaxID=3042153 RepID=UPI002B05BE91|nr:hypothetical protein [Rhizobium sp. CC-YZS058]MEA3535971.1 hypothetical protein [Rhizobium sp. CC-YZS058]